MARRNKSDSAGVLGIVVIGFVALVASVPKEVWIVAGIVFLAALIYYVFSWAQKMKAPTLQSEHEGRLPPALQLEPRVPDARDSTRQSPRASSTSKRSPTVEVSTFRVPLVPSAEVTAPTSVPIQASAKSGFRVPAAPGWWGPGAWIPRDDTVTFTNFASGQKIELPQGMVYVGSSLSTPSGRDDPCLINPDNEISLRGDFTERHTNYWPSYSEITPVARRAYLNWLADGRKHPEADIGYVFLFFYGLERRAIVDCGKDPKACEDGLIIAQELRRLLAIYGDKSGSFRNYGSSLLDWVELAKHPAKLYKQTVPEFPRTHEVPLYLRVALGQAAVDGAPVPAHVARAWARHDPGSSGRTAETRVADQFDKLFAQKYAAMCGPGIVLPRNRTKLKFVYRPASAGFRGCGELNLTFGDIPDVTVLTGPIKRLRDVVAATASELEPFSRYVGRNPNSKSSLEALLQLPVSLWHESALNVLRGLKARMGEGMVVMSFQELLSTLEAKTELTKDKVLGLARALESIHIALEPDVLAGEKPPKPTEKVVLFAVPSGEPAARTNPIYRAALLAVQLASSVAAADGQFSPKEIRHLRARIESWTYLTSGQQRRLLAQLRLRVATPLVLSTLKKKLDQLDCSAKETIAAFMAAVAHSDDVVSPEEVKMLERVYKVLGVDPKKVFSDVHAVTAGSATTINGDVSGTSFRLDSARVAELHKDTERVAVLLAGIFKDEESATTTAPTDQEEFESDARVEPTGLMGLDEAHTSLARMLLSRPEWRRAELLDVSADLDLMLDGALERINEASLDTYDLPFAEGDDPVTVSSEILQKVDA